MFVEKPMIQNSEADPFEVLMQIQCMNIYKMNLSQNMSS